MTIYNKNGTEQENTLLLKAHLKSIWISMSEFFQRTLQIHVSFVNEYEAQNQM